MRKITGVRLKNYYIDITTNAYLRKNYSKSELLISENWN